MRIITEYFIRLQAKKHKNSCTSDREIQCFTFGEINLSHAGPTSCFLKLAV